MIRDENLQNFLDYSEGQKEAAYRILVELVNLFEEYKDDIRVVGGWVPDLMFPNEGHVGSIDVDLLINHLTLQDAGYQNMALVLKRNGYEEHPDKYFSFIKNVEINGVSYPVDVDILAGMYGGTNLKRRSQHVQGIKALKATGGDFAFRFPAQNIYVEAKRPDGALDVAYVNVVAVVPYLIMKVTAMGRGKAKDAYDIYFLIKHYKGGIEKLAKEFDGLNELPIIEHMKQKLQEKFATEKHAGPKDVVDFLDLLDKEEVDIVKRDVYEQVQALLYLI